MSGAMIQERCPKCFGTWHRPLPKNGKAAREGGFSDVSAAVEQL